MPFHKDDIINRPTLEMQRWMKWFDDHLDIAHQRDKAHHQLTPDTGYYQAECDSDNIDSEVLKKIEEIYIGYGWEKLEEIVTKKTVGSVELTRKIYRLHYVR